MNERFEVIPLTGQWVNEVERVERLCFSDPWSRNGLLADLTSSTSFWYGAVERRSGRLAAFLGSHIVGDEGEIVNLATVPEHRRLGLAEALLQEFRRCHPGLRRVFLEVRASNRSAMALYEKSGFAACGVRRGYYENPPEDAVLMRLTLGENYADTGN